jgi:hypothetical protein
MTGEATTRTRFSAPQLMKPGYFTQNAPPKVLSVIEIFRHLTARGVYYPHNARTLE